MSRKWFRAHAVKVLLESGSHFLTHADFGCRDGVHKAWIMVDVDSIDEARDILPPVYRRQATIVQLSKFGLDELDDLIKRHGGADSRLACAALERRKEA